MSGTSAWRNSSPNSGGRSSAGFFFRRAAAAPEGLAASRLSAVSAILALFLGVCTGEATFSLGAPPSSTVAGVFLRESSSLVVPVSAPALPPCSALAFAPSPAPGITGAARVGVPGCWGAAGPGGPVPQRRRALDLSTGRGALFATAGLACPSCCFGFLGADGFSAIAWGTLPSLRFFSQTSLFASWSLYSSITSLAISRLSSARRSRCMSSTLSIAWMRTALTFGSKIPLELESIFLFLNFFLTSKKTS
mmetsp:Transcript_2146/g.4918  ORF Transcript_2146/g.4918 Transcript_2146/m.4918 type:complete len:250 (-) Transcript_2146:370-1119(-)